MSYLIIEIVDPVLSINYKDVVSQANFRNYQFQFKKAVKKEKGSRNPLLQYFENSDVNNIVFTIVKHLECSKDEASIVFEMMSEEHNWNTAMSENQKLKEVVLVEEQNFIALAEEANNLDITSVRNRKLKAIADAIASYSEFEASVSKYEAVVPQLEPQPQPVVPEPQPVPRDEVAKSSKTSKKSQKQVMRKVHIEELSDEDIASSEDDTEKTIQECQKKINELLDKKHRKYKQKN